MYASPPKLGGQDGVCCGTQIEGGVLFSGFRFFGFSVDVEPCAIGFQCGDGGAIATTEQDFDVLFEHVILLEFQFLRR